MSFSEIIIGLVVLAAVVYFVRHIRGLFKGTASCCGGSGGCAGCSSCQPKSSNKNKKTDYDDGHQSADNV